MLFSVSKVHWRAIKAVQIDSVNRRIVSVACESLTGIVYFLTVAYRATHKTKCCIITRDGSQTMKRFVAWRITVFKKLINTTWTEEKKKCNVGEGKACFFFSCGIYISHIQYSGCHNRIQYSMWLFYVFDLLLSLISSNSFFLYIKWVWFKNSNSESLSKINRKEKIHS